MRYLKFRVSFRLNELLRNYRIYILFLEIILLETQYFKILSFNFRLNLVNWKFFESDSLKFSRLRIGKFEQQETLCSHDGDAIENARMSSLAINVRPGPRLSILAQYTVILHTHYANIGVHNNSLFIETRAAEGKGGFPDSIQNTYGS